MHYYRMVDAIGSESFWLGEAHQERIDKRQKRLKIYTITGNIIMYVTQVSCALIPAVPQELTLSLMLVFSGLTILVLVKT